MNWNKMRCFYNQMNGRTNYKMTRAEGMKGKKSRENHLFHKRPLQRARFLLSWLLLFPSPTPLACSCFCFSRNSPPSENLTLPKRGSSLFLFLCLWCPPGRWWPSLLCPPDRDGGGGGTWVLRRKEDSFLPGIGDVPIPVASLSAQQFLFTKLLSDDKPSFAVTTYRSKLCRGGTSLAV